MIVYTSLESFWSVSTGSESSYHTTLGKGLSQSHGHSGAQAEMPFRLAARQDLAGALELNTRDRGRLQPGDRIMSCGTRENDKRERCTRCLLNALGRLLRP